MKRLLVLLLAGMMTPLAAAKVWVTVYQYDGKTPLAAPDANHPNVYRDIMVGTRLTLVIRSDTADKWCGYLGLSSAEAPYAQLSGRGLTPPGPENPSYLPTYQDSCLDAAGTQASVTEATDYDKTAFFFDNDNSPYLKGGGHPAYPGDWFVADYYAKQVGDCRIELYAPSIGPVLYPGVPPVLGPPTLVQTLCFTHRPSRDFNGDHVVDFRDFARLASHWHSAVEPNSPAAAALDLQADGRIDISDLALFSQFWLVRTDYPEPPISSDAAVKP